MFYHISLFYLSTFLTWITVGALYFILDTKGFNEFMSDGGKYYGK